MADRMPMFLSHFAIQPQPCYNAWGEWIEISFPRFLSDKRRSFRWKNWNPAPLAGAAAEKHIRTATALLMKNTNPCAAAVRTFRLNYTNASKEEIREGIRRLGTLL